MNPIIQQITQLLAQVDTQVSQPTPKTLSGLEFGQWLQPGNAGNNLGPSSQAHGTSTWGTLPAAGGFTMQELRGASSYDTFYFYRKQVGSEMNPYTKFVYSFDIIYSTAADLAHSQAFEWELQKCIDGYVYNMAFQADYKDSKKIRYFKYVFPLENASWIATEIPVDLTVFTAGKPISISSSFSLNHTAHTTSHMAITINGTVYALGITQPAWKSGDLDYFSNAIQDDCSATFEPFNRGIRNVRIVAA